MPCPSRLCNLRRRSLADRIGIHISCCLFANECGKTICARIVCFSGVSFIKSVAVNRMAGGLPGNTVNTGNPSDITCPVNGRQTCTSIGRSRNRHDVGLIDVGIGVGLFRLAVLRVGVAQSPADIAARRARRQRGGRTGDRAVLAGIVRNRERNSLTLCIAVIDIERTAAERAKLRGKELAADRRAARAGKIVINLSDLLRRLICDGAIPVIIHIILEWR